MSESGIAIIGAGMIGAAHAAGYRHHLARFPGLGASLETICDANAAPTARQIVDSPAIHPRWSHMLLQMD